jgi:hypothetical protein
MLKKSILPLMALFLVAAFHTPAQAQRARMVYLGNAHVDGTVDHDSIKVGRGDGTYRAIQLRISGGAVNFDRVIVRYGNGTMEEIQVRNRIPDGGRTRIIDLPGDRRIIQSVDIWYSKDRWTRRPTVSLYGIR